MNIKNFFASFIMLVAVAAGGFAQTPSMSCPTKPETFGVHAYSPVDQSMQVQVEVTYFTTNDPNVFISERAGINRSASSIIQNTNTFIAKLHGLEKDGLASIQKQQSATSYLGELAELNLERDSVNSDGRIVNASLTSANLDYLYNLDRETEISVTQDKKEDGNYYRVGLLSWFVDATPARGKSKIVDYDASMLLKPGETSIMKLFSDFELKRGGAGRKYMAVTLRSVSPTRIASAPARNAASRLR